MNSTEYQSTTPNPDAVSPPFSPRRDPDRSSPDHEEELHHELQKNLNLKESSTEENKEWDGWGDYEDEIRTGEDYKGDNHNDHAYEYDKLDYERNVDDYDDGGESERRFNQFPLRPEAEDCAYYMKTGNCKFGANCKFNHPLNRRSQISKEKLKDGEEGRDNLGKTECKFYMRTGGCKYGSSCRFNHSNAKTPVPQAKLSVPAFEINFIGLPLRPGENECPYYMRNGSCKFGVSCKFNHPNPTAIGGSDPPPAFSNGGSTSKLQVSSPPSVPSWSSTNALNGTAPFVPIVFPPTQVVPSPNAEWNGYQAPVYPLERSMHAPPAYVIGNPATETPIFAHQQVDEFPERPGQPECSFFMKTGNCKFKSNCKFHHPKNLMPMSSQCVLNDKGLPLRPGQSICSFYSRYGICKFGPGCKFDHSAQLTSAASDEDQHMSTLSNSARNDESRMAESRNRSDHTIQQTA